MIDLANHRDLIEAAPPPSARAHACVWLGRTYEGLGSVVKTLTAALSHKNLLFPRRPPNESFCQFNQSELEIIIFKSYLNILILSRIQMLNYSTQSAALQLNIIMCSETSSQPLPITLFLVYVAFLLIYPKDKMAAVCIINLSPGSVC